MIIIINLRTMAGTTGPVNETYSQSCRTEKATLITSAIFRLGRRIGNGIEGAALLHPSGGINRARIPRKPLKYPFLTSLTPTTPLDI